MSKFNYDVIVIGGGAAGLTASTFAAQSAAKTLLIEKEEKLGGDCLHYGCVPSKSLIKSAYAYHVIQNSEKYGLPKAAVPPVDFQTVKKRIRAIIDTIQEHDEPEYLQNKYNVDTKFGDVKFLDDHTITLNGEKITSRYFFITTGSSPFIPPVEGLSDVPYLTNMDIFSLDKLPETLIVMGGGPIGLEMAQAFNRLGSKVTVIQSQGQLLPKEDEDVAQAVKGRLQDEGVEIILCSKAVKVAQVGDEISVEVVHSGSGFNNAVMGKSLLVATGRRANVTGLDLDKAGVEFNALGIKVDNKMKTSAKNIYACGDVTGGLLFTHVASYEAIVAVTNAILKIPKKKNYETTPWVTYLDPEVASIGYNEKTARENGIQYTVHKEAIKDNDRALAESENNGFIKILFNTKGRVIGVQIVAYHAGDLIAEWIPVLNGKLKLSAITDSIHPYPTMAEINKNAATNYFVGKIPAWTKSIGKLLFGYRGKA